MEPVLSLRVFADCTYLNRDLSLNLYTVLQSTVWVNYSMGPIVKLVGSGIGFASEAISARKGSEQRSRRLGSLPKAVVVAIENHQHSNL